MSLFKNFNDYKDEIELMYIQNSAVECELYSLIATLLRESEQGRNISLRDVSARRTTENSKWLKGNGGFPDFVVLSREKNRKAPIYGCIEAKAFFNNLDDKRYSKQLDGHIKSYNKVIYTDGLTWRLYEKSDQPKKEVVLGVCQRENIDWAEDSKWFELLEMLDTINWVCEKR